MFYEQAQKVDEIKDTTGAGDAFWTGFLYAQLLKKSFEETKLVPLGALVNNEIGEVVPIPTFPAFVNVIFSVPPDPVLV
jgi:fructokinase